MIQIDFAGVHRLAGGVGNLVEPLRRAFAQPAVSPARAHYDLPATAQPRTLLMMPSWRPEGAIGVKIVTIFADNAARGLPSVNAAYLLLSESGQPRAWIDGRALTLLRTAAVSALAADLLVPTNTGVLLMVGTGALSRYLVEGHLAVRRYESVRVWGRTTRKAQEVVQDLRARGWPAEVAENLESAARAADVISCATLAEQPLIKGVWLKAQRHLDLVGSFKPSMREADDDCWRGAFVAVDTRAALEESGDLIEPVASGVVAPRDVSTLGDLATGAGAKNAIPKTVFKSVGVAHADLAVAEYLLERSAQSSPR
jgi:ornithine cyclodeaminase